MKEISVTELAAQQQPVIVDVREPDEFQALRVPGVIHIPMGEVIERVAEIPDDGPVYVICATGGRSARVAEYLASRDIDAYNVAGGTFGWRDAGLPVESGA